MRLECPREAKRLAQPVADAASAAGDIRLQALALAGLAEMDCLLCNYQESQSNGTRAAQLLQTLGDLQQESNALNIVARASSALGRNETAVEASLLSLELAKRAQDPRLASEAWAQLGHSLTYSRSFDAASAALIEAEEVAKRCGSSLDELVAIARQGNCEALRIVVLRHETGMLPTLERAGLLLVKFAGFKAAHDMAALAQPDQMPIQVFLDLVGALFHCWQGNLAETARTLHYARAWLDSTGVAPWMENFEALVACELAMAEQVWPSAERKARRMLELAAGTGNEQGAILGHMLLSHVFEQQNDLSSALAELKAIAARERQIRVASLATRPEVVAWQLDMRRSEQSRRDLQASTAQLTKLSMEDALTGIANRRCFDAEATQALRDGGDHNRFVCIALLDVDHFKQVNDFHGHGVGDKVLQVVAALLTEHVRQEDLAARLAGDEFVILFRQSENRLAWDICARLRTAVSNYPWQDIAPDLVVSVSMGVAQAVPGDSLEALLQRSDKAMYVHKNATRQAT